MTALAQFTEILSSQDADLISLRGQPPHSVCCTNIANRVFLTFVFAEAILLYFQ